MTTVPTVPIATTVATVTRGTRTLLHSAIMLCSAQSRASRRSVRSVLCALALLLPGLGACAPSPEEQAVEREEIATFLRDYLPRMAAAYRTGDVEPLAPYAAQKEGDSILRRVRELAKGGEVLDAELVSLEVEDVRTWSAVNAYVTTVEVWTLRVRATGSGSVLREEIEQTSRVKYQLKREGDRWRVFWRQLEQAFEG